MPLSYTWYTQQVIRETTDTVTIIFDTRGETFQYLAGQFINLTLRIDGQPVTRSYSLSSAPGTDAAPAITIKKVAGGLMSGHIVENAERIHSWDIDGPYGAFTLDDDTSSYRHIVLLAGGSGITPLFSIARTLSHQQPDARITLLYASRSIPETIFKNALDEWEARHNNIRIQYVLSKHTAAADDPANIMSGRLNRIIIKKLVKQAISDATAPAHFFLCGPAELMKLHQESLASLGVPETHIRLESFAPETSAPTIELPDNTQEVLLHYFEQSNLLEVQPGQTILAAALEERIPLPHSCQSGTCGRCAALLTQGAVHMQQNFALRKEDVDAGYVLLCQAFPLNNDVTVTIDG
ncbi:ferredoxin--NADP reductase [Chitinophaga oryzae]|uniref:Ferredoxin--NADP reductase n=1 Tax=Chitinophaga oryzae TaxID=2725414 RepID=A0AAE6ZHV1_9BACT|nr:ferredoxin--NADP reductase [Chitinophaga oryzae]QJB32079.1 ferredoxin--NADP reductase [Chitinophaga oryzae]